MQKDLRILCEKYNLTQEKMCIDISDNVSEEIIFIVMKKAKIYQKAAHLVTN
jgi:hypothetical protein